jgi:nitroimidazol reductase NimA-like FMN-containing flavoprotein (pyridoxamine 5'-phosphate oxidase superfamily)
MSSTSEQPQAAPNSVRRAIAKHSFCTLSTSSANRPHGVGVLYTAVDGVLYVSTQQGSKKARNIRDNSRVAVCIPVRRYPMAPPFLVQFGATAEILSAQHPAIVELQQARRLKKITSHGELDDPDTCFLRISPDRKVFTYGLGVPLRTLLRDPTHANRTFALGVA